MSKQVQRLFVYVCLLLAGWAWTTNANAAFIDIKADIRNIGLANNPTTFGVFVDSEGSVTYSETTDGANMVINAASYNGSQHGWVNVVATVAVDGPVKVTVGNCQYGGNHTVTIKNAEGEETSFSTASECWTYNPDEKVSSGKYMGGASTLTITCASYTPYIAVEAVDASSATVDFSLGDVTCEGTALPTGGTVAVGYDFTIPANNTLYKEGYTLTGWTDGNHTYAIGEAVTVAADMTLTPVFTENAVDLADRTEAVTLYWPFHPNAGCPTFNAQGNNNGTGIYVTQTNVGGQTVDVKLDYDATSGKLYNAGRTTWTQCTSGTKFTIPSCKGATVSLEMYKATSTTTIDGQSDYTSDKTISYEVANTAETIDVVIGDGDYIAWLKVMLPVVESNIQERAIIDTDFQDWAKSSTTSTVTTNFSNETITFTYENATVDPDATNENKFPTNTDAAYKGYIMSDKSASTITTTVFDNITKIRFRHGATGSNRGWVLKKKVGDGEWETVSTSTAQNPAWVEVEINEQDVQLQWYNLNTSQNAYMFELEVYANVEITAEQVTLTTTVTPEGAGTVSVYPSSAEYDKDSEVTLTATDNFGYQFKQWTKDGEVIGTDATLVYTLAESSTLTAEFEAVDTYELTLTVEGTNDYMVTVSPEPTVVDGKNMYEAGTQVTITANQYANLVTFTNWSDGRTEGEIQVTMDDDVTLTANYDQVDIIAGWDFYKAGNSGRLADFASEDNVTAAFTLTDGTSATSWLDKSTEKGGYESFKGAAVNWKSTVGDYYWQTTKINAGQYKNLNLQFQMLYNYNSYTIYNVEYSLDGTEWTKFGDITMEGRKAPVSFNTALPAECDNQASLYIRWIPDYDSAIDGTDGNDGNTIAMVFFTGTQQMADDDVPPVLVSTVPANETPGVSASGKIVLTFDEKVQIADGAKGFLNEEIELDPVVTGKTITFSYSGLDYASVYEFTLEAGVVSDLAGNAYAEDISILFETLDRPAIAKGLYDWVVPTDGPLEEAIAAANARSDKNTRYRIFLMDGTYTLPKSTTATIRSDDGNDYPSPITYLNASNVSIIGESTEGVIITNDLAEAPTFEGTYGTTSVYDGIGKSDVLQIGSNVSGTYFQNVTIKSGIGDGLGRNIAVQDKGTKSIYKDVTLWGYQDTWDSNNDYGLYYFENGLVRGRTDFLCGKGDAFFKGVDIQVCMPTGGYIAVPSKPAAKGWVFANCTIKGESGSLNGAYTLGRPWGDGTPIALWINTTMEVIPSAIGWSEMSDGWPARFAEYNSMTESGSEIDLSGRKTIFAGTHENNPVLTDEEADEALEMSNMFGEWNPTYYTEQAPQPSGVQLVGNTLTWHDFGYELLWAICKDGKVVDFTIEPTYTVDDATATWSVRAANEMGGLSIATEAVIPETVTVTISSSTYATFYYEQKGFILPEGLEAYTATKEETEMVLHPVEAVIPVGVPVVLHGEPGTYDLVRQDVLSLEVIDNDLIGSEEGGTFGNDGAKYYVLSWKNKQKLVDEVGFYWLSGSKGAYAKVKAHQAYMRVEASDANADGYTFAFEGETTGITAVEQVASSDAEVYTLSGIRMNNARLPKGIYIVGGKKMVVK